MQLGVGCSAVALWTQRQSALHCLQKHHLHQALLLNISYAVTRKRESLVVNAACVPRNRQRESTPVLQIHLSFHQQSEAEPRLML